MSSNDVSLNPPGKFMKATIVLFESILTKEALKNVVLYGFRYTSFVTLLTTAMTDPYCYQGLERKYREIARKELKESPEHIQAHIESLRRWLKQCPHISGCPEDDRFLLQHLRAAKFNQEKAQSRLENFCTVRGSPSRGVPSAFVYDGIKQSEIELTMKMGVQIPLGYNEQGELIILVRFNKWEPKDIDINTMTTVIHMGADVMMMDERMQIAGCHVIFDMGDFSKKNLEVMFNRNRTKNNAKIWQDGYAMRQKGFYYYREPIIFDLIFKMIKFWLSPKLQKRIHRFGHDTKKLHEKCPGSKKLLPTEYGGEAGPIEDCIKRWHDRFFEDWKNRCDLSALKVDETKRPAESKNFLRHYSDFPDEIFGTQGTFTHYDTE